LRVGNFYFSRREKCLQTYRKTLFSSLFSKGKGVAMAVNNLTGEGGHASDDYSKMKLFRK
jgi:hypothetical protein